MTKHLNAILCPLKENKLWNYYVASPLHKTIHLDLQVICFKRESGDLNVWNGDGEAAENQH